MNAARAAALERGLNGLAKKCLDAAPVSEEWDVGQIVGELMRTHNHAFQHRVVAGALDRLVESGLLKEPSPGHFRRAMPRPRLVTANHQEQAAVPSPIAVTTPPPESIVSKAGHIADSLRTIAGNLSSLSGSMSKLADDIEELALDADEGGKAAETELAQLRQLKALLKGLS